ncbi:MAG: bifunctional oligoribonuclease/PAP phosphatase NrnA [Clostridia bacterium]|nr:bifunctional oligoribonuclease/PAP phosphatase NrnA [Clostridia bacterium]
MSAYKDLTAKEAAERLLTIDRPVILIHVNPDADTVGSAAALARVFSALGKRAEFVCDDEIPSRLEFLTGGLTRAESTDGAEIVSIDVAAPKQGGKTLEALPSVALMIDHHEFGEKFADSYTVAGASSAAEVLLDIIDVLADMGKLTLTKEIAEPLYAAISSDTGGFRFSNATAKTFRLAARLIETGIDHADISHKLFFSKSKEQVKAESFIGERTELFADGRIAVSLHTAKDRESLGLSEGHFDCAIDVPRSIAGVEIAAVIRETGSGAFKASIRSTGPNVAEVAKKFGGGGHVRAAGCSPEGKDINEAKEKLVKELEKLIEAK